MISCQISMLSLNQQLATLCDAVASSIVATGSWSQCVRKSKRKLPMNAPSAVRVWTENRVIPTHLPVPPDKNPMFIEKRVFQGSSGKVYPLPFTDRIAEKPMDRKWKAVWIENEYLRVMILPEIGGRIHRIQDKTNGYDLIYHQHVIKPALVGLAGPWISGGIEFNWPQHHRPATFLPVDFEIQECADGSKIVWCGDHDPMCRMEGMHRVCLHPGRACVELNVRVYNRTPFLRTFLRRANVATRVHEGYQSFFPPDVYYVADHARRSMSEYPLAQGIYYGVHYGQRGGQGISPDELPSQFIPPHGHRQSEISNFKSLIARRTTFLSAPTSSPRAPTCAWIHRKISSAATTIRPRQASSMLPTTTLPPARNNGPGAIKNSAMPGIAT
jgi:hypothetical protein